MRLTLVFLLILTSLSFSTVTTMLFLTSSSSPDTEESIWIAEFENMGLTVETQQVSSSITMGTNEVLAMAHDFGSYHTAIVSVMQDNQHPLLLLGEAMYVCDDIAIFNGTYQYFTGGCTYMYKKGDYADILEDYSDEENIYMLSGGSASVCLNYYTEFQGAWLSNFWNWGSPWWDEVLMGVCDPGVHDYNGNNGYTGTVDAQICIFGHYSTNSTFTADFENIFGNVFDWFEFTNSNITTTSLGNIKALYQ